MDPDKYPGLGLLAAALMGVGLLRPRQRTDTDRLRELDAAEERHRAKLSSPAYIAAQNKRDRRRLRNLRVQEPQP